jgi:hypothetical protein
LSVTKVQYINSNQWAKKAESETTTYTVHERRKFRIEFMEPKVSLHN